MIPVELLELGKTVAVPLAVAVVLASLAQALPGRARGAAAALAAALAYGAADWWIAGPTGFPPRDVTHWVPWLMAGAALATGLGQERRPASLAAWILLAAALTWLLFRPLIRNEEWGRGATVLWFAGTGAVLAVVWTPQFRGVARPGWLLCQLALVTVAASACAFLGFSQKHAQLGGALAVVAGAGLLPWLGPQVRRAVAAAVSVGLPGLLILTLHYGSLRISLGQRLGVALLLAAAWATANVTCRGDEVDPRRRRRFVAAGAVLAAAAVGLALWARLALPEDPYAY